MGCDIHIYAEVKLADKWELVGDVFPHSQFDREYTKKEKCAAPFDWRNYGMFGFLAGVRNSSHVPVIAEPKRAIPEDATAEVASEYEDWGDDAHTATWLTARQLAEFDYEQVFWDRRVTKQVSPNCWDGAALADEGEGEHLTIREFLGELFFEQLEVLKGLGAPDDVRVVFWFDS